MIIICFLFYNLCNCWKSLIYSKPLMTFVFWIFSSLTFKFFCWIIFFFCCLSGSVPFLKLGLFNRFSCIWNSVLNYHFFPMKEKGLDLLYQIYFLWKLKSSQAHIACPRPFPECIQSPPYEDIAHLWFLVMSLFSFLKCIAFTWFASFHKLLQ